MRNEIAACETVAAIAVHARELTERGLMRSGGCDTKTLCGRKAGWDLGCPANERTVTCRTCRAELGYFDTPGNRQ